MKEKNHRTGVETGEDCNKNIISREGSGWAGLTQSCKNSRYWKKKKSTAFQEWWSWERALGALEPVPLFYRWEERSTAGSNLPVGSQQIRGKGETMNDFIHQVSPSCATCWWPLHPSQTSRIELAGQEDMVSWKARRQLRVSVKASVSISRAEPSGLRFTIS